MQEILTGPVPHASARRVSIEALSDAVIELIHAVNSVLNEELESAVASVQRCAELLQINARLPEFSAITEIASPIARGGIAPWRARIVKTHVDTHLDGNRRTKELARLVQLSSFHFCRVFRVSFGESPHAYVTLRRVERAQGLTTNLTLGQITLDCGFADHAHFNKIFRRLCGESPGEWRRTGMGGKMSRHCRIRSAEDSRGPRLSGCAVISTHIVGCRNFRWRT